MNILHRNSDTGSLSNGRALSLLLVAVCWLMFSATQVQAETFTVPGTSGNRWFDTGLDLAPGTLVRLSATGQVDVGSGWGVHGPEGTTHFANVLGYPAATRFRYGLVARITHNRSNPADEQHNDYSYGEAREFCATGGGHLWLTVNDDQAANNTGQFIVELTRSTCQSDVTGTPATLRGRFRVRLNGFTVNRQTWDDGFNSDGWADEVYVAYNIDTVDVSGRRDPTLSRTVNWASSTATFGDAGGGRTTRVRAGNATSNGGLVTGNSFPASMPWRGGSRDTGSAIFQADLIQGRTGGVIIPAIFETDLNRDLLDTYNRTIFGLRSNIEASLADLIRGPALRAPEQFLRSGETLGLGDLLSRLSHGDSFTGESVDRPVGMAPPTGGPIMVTGGAGGLFPSNTYTFMPKALVLTYEAADIISRSDFFGKGRGVIEIRYQDDERLKGDYTLYFQVDRVY